MKKGLLVSLIAIAVFILTSAVGANVQKILKKGGNQDLAAPLKPQTLIYVQPLSTRAPIAAPADCAK